MADTTAGTAHPAMISRRGMLRLGMMGAFAAGGTGFLAACGSGSPAPATHATPAVASGGAASGSGAGNFGTIKFQLSWIRDHEFVGEYMASQNGYYKDAGFDNVELLALGGSTTVESLLLAGKADIGLSSPPITAAAVMHSQAPLKVIGATYQKNPFAFASLANRKPVRTAKDLIGKKLGVQSGGNQILVNGLLKANGISLSQVQIVGVEYDPSVLFTGKVDAFVTYVTDDLKYRELGYEPVILSFADNGLPFVAETFTVLQDTIDQRRDMLKAFLTAEIRGWTAAVKNPAQATRLDVDDFGKGQDLQYKEEYGLVVEVGYELIVDADTNKNGLFTMTDSLIAANVKSLATMGYPLTAGDLFDLSLLDEVYKENPDLIVKLSPTHDAIPS